MFIDSKELSVNLEPQARASSDFFFYLGERAECAEGVAACAEDKFEHHTISGTVPILLNACEMGRRRRSDSLLRRSLGRSFLLLRGILDTSTPWMYTMLLIWDAGNCFSVHSRSSHNCCVGGGGVAE